jgi:hypothetical protein
MGISLWTSSSPLGQSLLIPGGFGSPPVVRAFIPSKYVEGFASEPAVEWRGSVAATGVRDVAKQSLSLLPDSECACEIWADESAPEPRTFGLGTADEIVSYVDEWSSRANVSLSIGRSSDSFPMIYVWGAVRNASTAEETDEVGIKFDRSLIVRGGVDLVLACFKYTLGSVAQSSTFDEFLTEFSKRVLA